MSCRVGWAFALVGVVGVAVGPDFGVAQRQRVVAIEVMPADAQVAVGAQQVFVAVAYDRDNNPVMSAAFAFSSSNVHVAAVDAATGLATGISPGTVVITARTGTGTAARSATATLTVVPAGPTAAVAQAAPSGPPVAPAGDCSSASTGVLNPNRSCYDQRPVPRAPLLAAAPQSCTDPVTPAAMLVHVSAQGEVIEVRPTRGSSNCAAFAAVASVFLRDLAFVPAQLQGTAVEAWANVLVRPAPPGLRDALRRSPGPGAAALDRQPDGSGPAAGLVVTPLRVVLGRGESRQLGYHSVRADGENAERVPIVFTVVPGGEGIVTVDSVGLIRAAGDTGIARVRLEVPGNKHIQPRQVVVEVHADGVRSVPVPARRPVE